MFEKNPLYALSAVLIGLFLLAPALSLVHEAHAQEVSCADSVATAERNYMIGQFDASIDLLTGCIEAADLDDEQRRNGLRILGLSYVAKDREADAREAVRRLLEVDPSFQPDPVMEPPAFVDLVEEVQTELDVDDPEETPPSVVVRDTPQDPPPPNVTPAPTSGGSGMTRWLIIGGAVVAGGVAAVLLFGGGGGGSDPLPPPPALPPIN